MRYYDEEEYVGVMNLLMKKLSDKGIKKFNLIDFTKGLFDGAQRLNMDQLSRFDPVDVSLFERDIDQETYIRVGYMLSESSYVNRNVDGENVYKINTDIDSEFYVDIDNGCPYSETAQTIADTLITPVYSAVATPLEQ